MNDTNTQTKVKVGDIFKMSWGYDQTNVNFFKVVRLTPSGAYVREIGLRPAGGEGFMCQNVVADDQFLANSQWCGSTNSEKLVRLSTMIVEQKPSFKIKGRYYAFMWDGKPTYNSWYA